MTSMPSAAASEDFDPKRTRKKNPHRKMSHGSSAAPEMFDVVIAADMAGPGDLGSRIGGEIEATNSAGYRIGLVHLPSPHSLTRIAPQIRRTVQEGKSSPIDPAAQIQTDLLVVHIQHGNFDSFPSLMAVEAKRVVIVADRMPAFDVNSISSMFGSIGPMSWAPTNPWVRAALAGLSAQVSIEDEDWAPVVENAHRIGQSEAAGELITIGQITGSGATQWPESRDELEQVLPADGTANVLLVGTPPASLLPSGFPPTWKVFGHGDVAIEWALGQMDVLVYFPGAEASEIPDTAIATALCAGKLVLLPPRLRTVFGAGAVYCQRADVQATIRRILDDPDLLAQLRESAKDSIGQRFSAKRHCDRVASLIEGRRKTQRKVRVGKSRRAIFLASNGIGLGHVARLLAIARRAAGRFEPVFATMAHAAHIIEQFGYVTEYIPSQMYVGSDPAAWDDWLGCELECLIERYQARLVVYDGNNLPAGLSRAIMSFGDCKLVWVRRSMGENAPLPTVVEARLCDAIIEPQDMAFRPQYGGLALKRRGIIPVEPVRLLDEDELLTREDAAATLGLDPDKPAVLIHLGAGSNRDITRIIDVAVRVLTRLPDVQIATAEWANAPSGLSLWPEALVIEGFPISQYFNAFDFSIGAAGYNTFHEAISFELPTIFMANASPEMDDQVGRARFAQASGAAFELPEDRLIELPAICEVLLNEHARAVLRENCRRIRRENGADQAADIIGRLAGSDETTESRLNA